MIKSKISVFRECFNLPLYQYVPCHYCHHRMFCFFRCYFGKIIFVKFLVLGIECKAQNLQSIHSAATTELFSRHLEILVLVLAYILNFNIHSDSFVQILSESFCAINFNFYPSKICIHLFLFSSRVGRFKAYFPPNSHSWY